MKAKWPPKTKWRRDITCSYCSERLEIGPADVYSCCGVPSFRCSACGGEGDIMAALLPKGSWTDSLPLPSQYEAYRRKTNRGYAQEIYREPR